MLWFVGEDVPNRIAWRDELKPVLPAGYDFDGCDARPLLAARVDHGRIVLPSGAEYRVLLLPDLPTMRPAVVKKFGELAAAGATVLGPRPQQSPSLRDLGEGDATVRELAEELWSGRVASDLRSRNFSSGSACRRISSGARLARCRGALRPSARWRRRSLFPVQPEEPLRGSGRDVSRPDGARNCWIPPRAP